MPNVAKPGRNESCPCGSGRKFKRCCGAARPAPGSAQAALPIADADPFDDACVPHLLARRYREAIVQLRRSIELRPGIARTHYHLGLALGQVGDDEAALTALRNAISLAPQLAEAHGLQGDLLLGKGQWDHAAAAYARASAASPGTALGQLCAAKALFMRDRSSEAEERLRSLIASDPSCTEAHLMLGHLLSDAGRFAEAAASYERTLDRDPGSASAYHGLVSSKRLTEADRPLVERIATQLDAADDSLPRRMTLHFAAGKALDDLDDCARAIEHFDAANRIRRQLSSFDRGDFQRQIDGLIASFTPDFFRLAALGADDETPVLVLGMPRSGTTLIERIVSSHTRAAGGGELRFWRDARRQLAAAPPSKRAEAAAALRTDYLKLLRSLGPHALRVTDKMPFNFLWIGLLHMLLPRARIVHCRRNPVDTCLSIYGTQFAENWGFASDRGDLAFYYRQYLRLMDHWRAVLPPDRLLEVDYEAVIAAPEATARKLIAFCGLEWDAACLQPERNPSAVRTASKWQARQPIYRTSVERWRRYEPWIGELRELGEALPT